MSVVIKDRIDDGEYEISVPQVNMKTLKKILEFCDHVVIDKNMPPIIEKPLFRDLKEVISEWYHNYI